MPTVLGVPMIYPTIIAIGILLIVGFALIPSFFPTQSYGNTSKKVRQGTIKLLKTNNPVKPMVKLGNKFFSKKKEKVDKYSEPINLSAEREKRRPKVKDSQYDIISLAGLSDTVYVIYDKSCTINGRDYRLGDYHGEEWVHFKVHPYFNKDGSYSIILRDPYLPSNKQAERHMKSERSH
jgi:hypothetical protein